MSLKYRTSAGTSASNFSDLVVKVGDTLPIGTEVDYDGQTAPAGWQEVDDPNVYSTTETRIGTWINGKPLYRKVIETTTPTVSTDGQLVNKSVPVGVNNVGLIYVDKAIVIGGGNYNVSAIISNMAFNNGLRFEANSTNITMYCNSTIYSDLSAKVILEYTKTTD